jgi:hypothetical protein
MSLLWKNIPVLLSGLDIIIALLTGYESTVSKYGFGTNNAHDIS